MDCGSVGGARSRVGATKEKRASVAAGALFSVTMQQPVRKPAKRKEKYKVNQDDIGTLSSEGNPDGAVGVAPGLAKTSQSHGHDHEPGDTPPRRTGYDTDSRAPRDYFAAVDRGE